MPSHNACVLTYSTLQVNYQKLAELGGYKTANSASAVYFAAKKKALAGMDGNTSTTPGTPKTPNTPRTPKSSAGKKRATPAHDAGSDDEENLDTKPVLKKGRGGKKVKVEQVEDSENGMDSFFSGAAAYASGKVKLEEDGDDQL